MTTCQLSLVKNHYHFTLSRLSLCFRLYRHVFLSVLLCHSFLNKHCLSLPLSHINNVTKCIPVFKPWQGPSVTFLFNNKHKKRGTERQSEGDSVCVQHRNENDMLVECITLALTYLVWPTQQFLLPSVCKQPHLSGSQWTHWVQSGTSYMSTLRVTAYLRIYLGFRSYTFNYS